MNFSTFSGVTYTDAERIAYAQGDLAAAARFAALADAMDLADELATADGAADQLKSQLVALESAAGLVDAREAIAAQERAARDELGAAFCRLLRALQIGFMGDAGKTKAGRIALAAALDTLRCGPSRCTDPGEVDALAHKLSRH